jgi:RNA polymerase sigma-70 factor (ECF subfamily)
VCTAGDGDACWLQRGIRHGAAPGSPAADIWPGGNRAGAFRERNHVTAISTLRTTFARRVDRRGSIGRLERVTDLHRIDDDLLVARVAAGDEHALGALHDRHARLALAVASRLLRDSDAAHEVVQDAFLDLWRTAPDYDADRALVTTWLVRLVRLRAIDRIRRDGAQRRGAGAIAAGLDEAAHVSSADDVAGTVERSHEAARVRDALELLPVDQRTVVELAFLDGLTHAELAERLGLPVGTVKTRCFRGLARLAQLLDPAGTEVRP